MTRLLMWSIAMAAMTIGSALLYRAMREARVRLEHGLKHAEAVAGHTRAALEETEDAIRDARQAIRP